MEITEAGRKYVASTEFPQEYLRNFRNRQEECTTVDDQGGLMMWLINGSACGLQTGPPGNRRFYGGACRRGSARSSSKRYADIRLAEKNHR
jgi:hypothetical protein